MFNVNFEWETVQLKAAGDTVVLKGKNWPEEKITIKYKSQLKAADPFEKERHVSVLCCLPGSSFNSKIKYWQCFLNI